jgi:hypothetical protein
VDIVLDLPNPDMFPAIAEPLFQGFDANVETHPAMNLDDLKGRFQPYKDNKEYEKFSSFDACTHAFLFARYKVMTQGRHLQRYLKYYSTYFGHCWNR